MEMHPKAPWTDITFAGVYWNCAERLENLLVTVRPWFTNIVVCVQESPDNTLEVAHRYADVVLEDVHTGVGDTSLQKVIDAVKTRWVFVVSDDEMPSYELLNSFQDLVTEMRKQRKDGAWVRFHSSIEGFDFTGEQDAHLRVFERFIKWPATQHARPNTENTLRWGVGHIDHDRSLDEMVRDYLTRIHLQIAAGNADSGMQAHNIKLTKAACNAIADRLGWDYVTAYEWWPEVVEFVYGGESPAPVPEPEPEPDPKPARMPRRRGR